MRSEYNVFTTEIENDLTLANFIIEVMVNLFNDNDTEKL